MNRRQFLGTTAAGLLAAPALLRQANAQESPFRVKYFPVTAGMGSRDTTPAPDGTIWFCGQRNGTLGRLDPRNGSYKLIDLGKGAAPHGVIIGPDGAPWVTEGGQNAIARVDPGDHKVTLFRLPEKEAYANLNTGIFDKGGIYWFTGQSGYYGRLDPKSGAMKVFDAPRGVGPYGIAVTPNGDVLPCQAASSIPGLEFDNVRDKPLSEIWFESDAFNRFRGTDWMPAVCKSCPLDRQEVDFGCCRCQALALVGDATAVDPVCMFSDHHSIITDAVAKANEITTNGNGELIFRTIEKVPVRS